MSLCFEILNSSKVDVYFCPHCKYLNRCKHFDITIAIFRQYSINHRFSILMKTTSNMLECICDRDYIFCAAS